MNEKSISKFLSLVLRHNPGSIGLQLDANGWADVNELIAKMQLQGVDVDLITLNRIVQTSDKQRFTFNSDNLKIRANQGHSIEVDVELENKIPPIVLYHGTTERFAPAILEEGLKKMTRLHVHLSDQIDTAKSVGARHGTTCVLLIDSERMVQDGCIFYLSKNNVWLTDDIHPKYIRRIN